MFQSKNNFLIRGDNQNPFHFSVGQVILNDGMIALIRKKDGVVTLPRETIHVNENLSDCVFRGAREEIGAEVSIIRFLGSLIASFDREDRTEIEKTTVYFLTQVIDLVERNPEEDEITDEIVWVTAETAIEMLGKQKNPESEIIKRVL